MAESGQCLKIAAFASHGGSNLQAIIDAIEADALNARIVLVISNNSNAMALERAKKHGLPTAHFSSKTHPDPDDLDREICRALKEAGTDLIVLAGYMRKIGPVVLNEYQGRILNIHPALLPRHGGPGMYGIRPHEAVLASGDQISGATVHVVDAEYDKGPILCQERVTVEPGDTPETLQQRVLQVEHRLYPRVVRDITEGRIGLPVKS